MWHLYLDESGDLGFNFEEKRPSDHLTVCILATQSRDAVKAIRCAVKKTLKRKVNRSKRHKQELKGSNTSIAVRRYFYKQLVDVPFSIYALTLRKRDVRRYLLEGKITQSELYDMVSESLLSGIPFDGAPDGVELVVDKSKNRREAAEFNRVIGKYLAGRVEPSATVTITHCLSYVDLGLSAADLFCWGIFRRYEAGDSEWYEEYRARVDEEVYP